MIFNSKTKEEIKCPTCGGELYGQDGDFGLHFHCYNNPDHMFEEDDLVGDSKWQNLNVYLLY